MPQSKGRSTRSKKRYQLEPSRKKEVKGSPRWFGPLMLVIMGVGVLLIVWNYLRPPGEASNTVLMSGLGLIGVGFFGITFWK